MLNKIKNNLKQIKNKFNKNIFLFQELVKRDFNKKYKRTVLGVGWSILSPLLQLLVMSIIFTNFFGKSTPHYVIYMFCGNLIFAFFKEATSGGMLSLHSNSSIFIKVNVPKYLFLLSRNIQALINFGIILVIFFIFVAIDGISFTWKFLLLIYPIMNLIIFNIGLGLILSALFIFFRDIQYLYDIFTMMLMYVSAIFYTTESYSSIGQNLFYCNPIYLFITYFREIVIQSRIPSAGLHFLIALWSIIMLLLGAKMYKKNNYKFLYYI